MNTNGPGGARSSTNTHVQQKGWFVRAGMYLGVGALSFIAHPFIYVGIIFCSYILSRYVNLSIGYSGVYWYVFLFLGAYFLLVLHVFKKFFYKSDYEVLRAVWLGVGASSGLVTFYISLQDVRFLLPHWTILFIVAGVIIALFLYYVLITRTRVIAIIFLYLFSGVVPFLAILFGPYYLPSTMFSRGMEKGVDASIKASTNNIRAAAEVYFDDNNGSYLGVCNDEKYVIPLLEAVKWEGGTASCFDSKESYAVESELKAKKGNYFCIDHAGNANTFEMSSISVDDHECGSGL